MINMGQTGRQACRRTAAMAPAPAKAQREGRQMSECSLLRYRLDVVSRWPDGARKSAYLKAIIARLDRLRSGRS